MSSAAIHTQPPAPPAGGPLAAFIRALLAWALGLSPLERMRRGAEQMLAEIARLLFDPEIALLERPLDEDDARNLARLLDVADAFVSTYVWGLARQHAGLIPLIGRGAPRILARRHAPDGAAILARFRALHRRFHAAQAKAARLAARLTASDALGRTQPHAEAAAAAPSTPAFASTPTPAPSLARHVRPGLLERALAIADWRPSYPNPFPCASLAPACEGAGARAHKGRSAKHPLPLVPTKVGTQERSCDMRWLWA